MFMINKRRVRSFVMVVSMWACVHLYITNSRQQLVFIYESDQGPDMKNSSQRSKPDTMEVQRLRKQKLEHICAYQNIGTTPVHLSHITREHILVNDRKKLLFCYMPGVASVNWMKVLTEDSNDIRTKSYDIGQLAPATLTWLAKYGYQPLSSFPPQLIPNKFRTHFKFMFVRNPYERLYSAYKHFLDSPNKTKTVYGAEILLRYRKDISQEAAFKGEGVLFEEFLKYIIDQIQNERELSHNWASYQSLCDPCSVHYDFIGRLESSKNTEANFFMGLLGLNTTMHSFPEKEQSSVTKSEVVDAYSTVSRQIMNLLIQTLVYDFTMFGYNPQEFYIDIPEHDR